MTENPAEPGFTGPYSPEDQEPSAGRVITERPGSRIGPYRLMEQIGEGGFGLVFVAEQQEPVRRKVALKIIKPGMDTRQVIARFEAERQALALMDHPNIARVLDAGATESGRPYFVMELVRGIPITEYCDKNQLTPRERLELFITVCQAVQHAHQKGIIHRDIKPSNVLVTSHDGKPVAKIIDFGVAKAISQHLTDRTIYTQFAQMIGTPLYMSPEQAEMSGLDIDTRSDIYSLGVLLYELLTGTTPIDKRRFAKAAYDEIRRLIREEEPPKPSTRISTSESVASVAAQRRMEPAKLTKLVRGDLDWITMKCLEKDRTRRYETANGLARDIQRYLSDEPVEASPPSARYRLRKFAKKNRAALTTAATIAALLVAGITISTWQAVRATRAEAAALRAQRDAEDKRQEADAARQREAEQRREAVTQAQLANAVKSFLQVDVLQLADPATQRQTGGLNYDADLKLRDVVVRAAERIEGKFADQPLVEAEIRMTLATTLHNMGRADLALPHEERALHLRTQHLGPVHANTLLSVNNLAVTYETLGRYDDALRLREENLQLCKQNLGPDHEDTLGNMNNLAISYAKLGRLNDAVKLFEETLPLVKQKLGPGHPRTLMGMGNLGSIYSELGRHADALKLTEETYARCVQKLGPDHLQTLENRNNLAGCYAALHQHAEAQELFEENFRLCKQKLGPDHPYTLGSMLSLAQSYRALERHADAIKLCHESVALHKQLLGPDHPDTLTSLEVSAACYFTAGRYPEAVRVGEEVLSVRKQKLGPDHPATIVSMNNLANAYAAVGRTNDELTLREETLRLIKAKLGPDHPHTLVAMSNLAMLLANFADAKLRDPVRALALATEAVQKSPQTADYRGTLGATRYRTGDWKGAIADLEQAIRLRKPDDTDNVANAFFLAMAHWQLADKVKAREWFDKAVQWMEKGKLNDAVIKRFRAEAAELLGVPEPTPMPEPPADKVKDKK